MGANPYTLRSCFILSAAWDQKFRLGNNADLNPSTVNPASAYPGLTPVGDVWGPQAF